MRFEPYPFQKLAELLQDLSPNDSLEPIDLTIGEPKFQTPANIIEALQTHAPLLNRYPKSRGEEKLREAQREFVQERFNETVSDSQIIPTLGTRELLFNFPQFLLHGVAKPKMAFTNPFYQIYEGAAIAAGAETAYLSITAERYLPEHFQSQLAGANLVILNFPNNPTTLTLDLESLTHWTKAALDENFVLLNDECYSEIYRDTPPPSLLQAASAMGNDAYHNILVCNSISKRSSAPGLRSGFIAGDAEILAPYLQYRTYLGCASPLPLQEAAAVAWSDRKEAEAIRQQYRNNLLLAEEILGITAPEATFYLWLDVDNDLEAARQLYTEQNLKTLPGSYLGREGIGKQHLRIALVENESKTREALIRLKTIMTKAA